ncbi:hybrid sensor histidine kinase/response regulator [Mucilaginibacter gotjawali]|uniref:Signal transduction histidine kinase/CheY-like chemotaxis protein n=2 Tax=Mucilaginibacter gotjawali TaxID=1550579 RepID=A0A839SMC5_9SPHI|nr:sensor histidine kinase [Mucilaginibacter gotjawali]MBB3057577.1 signal transduction histidine kinase/CheY-like chemotaxis protein [Mucilaginibacter gotjawali]BAU55235.1 Autoinducer 2 sensor kinase/phosphatase LuxQ [Mucilaginibacter gotjawali]
MHVSKFFGSVKGKIITASILACFAVLMAWVTSKSSFQALLVAFEDVSAPNEKLRIINELSRNVVQVGQSQEIPDINNPDRFYRFFNETKKLSRKIDTLKNLYANSPDQIKRLNILKKLLHDRDRLFINYLKVRNELVSNKTFHAQMHSLNDMVSKKAGLTDSMVTTTEKKTSTTTIYPITKATDESHSNGFFSKLFRRKKESRENKNSGIPYQVVDEESSVKHDTLSRAVKDSMLKEFGATIHHLEAIQQRKSLSFLSREAILLKSSSKVMHQILTILRQVETDGLTQSTLSNRLAKNMVDSSIRRISLIMLAFFVATTLLLYLTLTDISKINRYRKQIELAKEEAEYHSLAKQRFLSNMSHEIRTPLQSIIGFAEKMNKQKTGTESGDIDAIYKSSAHLMQIVNEVLDYNRIVSGKFTFTNQVFNLMELLDEVTSVMQLQAEKKHIELKAAYDAPVSAFVNGDPFRLKQILYNLLGNAIKFTPEGKVLLSVKGTPGDNSIHYNFDISDTGIGLSDQDIERIFNEFEQADNNNKHKYSGSGLGLPITKELIEMLGGNISVKSRLGKGSMFSFDLKYEKALKPETMARGKTVPVQTPDRDIIWLVDDDPFMLELYAGIFDRYHKCYRCFTSPFELLNAAPGSEVNYILMDIRMPEMNGIELCSLLRAKLPATVKLFAVTAQALPEERSLILKQGFDGLLMKPFRAHDLINMITKGGQVADDKISIAGIDMSLVEKMTFGDPKQTFSVLNRFAEDSLNDIEQLNDAIEIKDSETVLLITHRIAGRTAQVGAKVLAGNFRIAEMDLEKDKKLTANKINHLVALTDKLQELASAVKETNKLETPA